MDVSTITTLVGSLGLPVFLVVAAVFAAYKAGPAVLRAYKEGNDNIVSAITKLAVAFETRLSNLETKVDNIKEDVDDIKSEIRKE